MSADNGVRILLLDGVAIKTADAEYPVPGKPGALLAALALDAGRTVPVERLIDGLWGELPPASARALVHTYVSALRRTLASAGAAESLSTAPGGYRLAIQRDRVDALCFLDLVASARGHSQEHRLLEDAAAMWPGAPLAGITEPLAGPWRTQLDEAWRAVRRRGWELAIADGHAEQIVPELRSATVAEPLQESVHLLLASALHQTGRSDEALDVLADVRIRLAEELGLDPSPRVDELRGRILRHETDSSGGQPNPTSTLSPPTPTPAFPSPAVPVSPPAKETRPAPPKARRWTFILLASVVVGGVLFALQPAAAPSPSGPSLLVLNTDGVVAAAVALPAAPTNVQVANGLAWVSSTRARTVTSVDLAGNAIDHVMGMREPPTSISAQAASATVALGYSGEVVQITPDGAVSAPRPGFEDSRGRLVLAAHEKGTTWAASIDGRIAPLDGPSMAKVEAQPLRLAVEGGRAWILADSPVSLHVVDLATSATVTSALRGQPEDLALKGTEAWVVTSGDDRLWRADPATGRVVATRALPGRPIAVDATDGMIWVATREPNSLVGYNEQTLTQVLAVSLPRPPADLAVHGRQLVIVTE